MTGSYRRSNTDIKINSAHLPVAVLAWQSPALLVILIVTGALTIFTPVALFFASPELKKAPVFSENTRNAQAFYSKCYALNRLERPEYTSYELVEFCKAKAELFRQGAL